MKFNLRTIVTIPLQRCQALINAFGFRFASGEKCLAPVQLRTVIIFLLLPIVLLACSGESGETSDPTLTAVRSNIIGSWVSTDINASSDGTWQFLPDGTFIDTQGASFQYQIHEIDGFNYIALNADELNIEPSEELGEALEDSLGNTDFIPIYQVRMPSSGSIVIEPATNLYGSDSYFGFTFQTYVLKRQ